MAEVLNIGSESTDWRAQRLSNFSADPFMLDGEQFASVEGFIQGIKFPEGDSRRNEAFRSVGVTAKRLGRQALAPGQHIWWRSQQIAWGSSEHHHLIERAIRAKFEQSGEARVALIASGDLTITHDVGRPESPQTSLPAAVFCDILTRIRHEWQVLHEA